jgi:hypothetical protein
MHCRSALVLLLAAVAGTAPVVAQETGRPQQGPQQAQRATEQQMQQQTRMQEMDRLMERMRATNEWMTQHRTHEHFRQLGAEMTQTGDRIRQMLQRCDQARATLNPQQDRDRLRDMDRLQDRLHDIQRDMDRAHDQLRKTIGQT